MKVTTPSIGLKVPGPASYLMGEVYAVAYEDELIPGKNVMDHEALVAARRRTQLVDLRAMLQELPALFQAALEAGSRAPVRPTPPSVRVETAAEHSAIAADRAYKPSPEPVPRSAPPAVGPGPSAPGGGATRSEAKAEPARIPHPPPTWGPAEAEALLRTPGREVAAAKRVCSNTPSHKTPLPIDSRVWDYSIQNLGRPLCLSCQRGGAA